MIKVFNMKTYFIITIVIITTLIQSCGAKKKDFINELSLKKLGDSLNIDSIFNADISDMYIFYEYTSGKDISRVTHIDYEFEDVKRASQCLVFKLENGDFIDFNVKENKIEINFEDYINVDSSYEVIAGERHYFDCNYNSMKINKSIYIEQRKTTEFGTISIVVSNLGNH